MYIIVIVMSDDKCVNGKVNYMDYQNKCIKAI